MRNHSAASLLAYLFAASLPGLASQRVQAETAQTTPTTARVYDFQVSALPMEQALVSIAHTANGIVLFAPELVAKLECAQVQGSMTLEVALRTALAGSSLELVRHPDGSFGVRRAAAAAAQEIAPATPELLSTPLPPVLKLGTSVSGDTGHGYSDTGFVATTTRAATRTETPLSDLPQSIQEVTSGLIESQQAHSVLDTLQNISSVTYERGDGIDQAGTLYVRNFVAPLMKNGLADLASLRNVTNGRVAGSNAITSQDVPMAAIERVEVMGGADSIIVGGPMEPGGSVNIVTKQPVADTVREWTLEIDNRGHRHSALDLGGSLLADQSWTYRAILSAVHDKRSFDGYDGMREFYIAPSIGYKRGETSFVTGFSHQVSRTPFGGYQSAMLTDDGPGPDIHNSPWGRADDHSHAAKSEVFYSLEQALGDDWTFSSKGRFNRLRYTSSGYVNCVPLDLDQGTGVCLADQSTLNSYSAIVDNSLRVNVKTGEWQHTVLAGASIGRSRLGSYTDADNYFVVIVPWPPSSLALLPVEGSPSLINDRDTIYYSNLYFQDQMKWRRWHVLLNVGYEQERNNFSLDTDMNGVLRDTSPPRNMPVYNLGLAYRLSQTATVYGNTFRSFTPGSKLLDSTLNGGAPGINVAPATTGKSSEIGVKLNLLDNRAVFTAALYRATHTNVLQFVPSEAITPFNQYVLLPSAVSRGLELSLSGRLVRGWNLTASYSYSSFRPARAAGDDSLLAQFPHHRASLWSTYDLQSETWRGWGAGLGFTLRSGYTAFSDADTLIHIGGQLRSDARLYYHSRAGTTTLGIKNLLNRRLYSEFATTTIGVEPARTVTLTQVIEF